MPPDEFELIRRHFAPLRRRRRWLAAGIGEDCALLKPPRGRWLALSADTLSEGGHFPRGAAGGEVAQRALRVNLSDLAACGAEPLGFLLALSIPEVSKWLDEFSSGLAQAAREFDVDLIGGDTTRAALSVTMQVIGVVEVDAALRRDGARDGDDVYVSGAPGEAAAGLRLVQSAATPDDESKNHLIERYWRPSPRLELGRALLGTASAAIDVSDGVFADAMHVAEASGARLRLDANALPLSSALRAEVEDEAAMLALTGGDDYELLFTAPAAARAEVQAAAGACAVACTKIGEVKAGASGVDCAGLSDAQSKILRERPGWRHF